MQHLLHHKLINWNQHGFVSGRYTITNVVEEALQPRQPVDVTCLDFKKAFDSMSQNKFFYTKYHLMASTATSGVGLPTFYHWGANASTSVGLYQTALMSPATSQGNVLGCILFLLHINELPDLFKDSNFVCKCNLHPTNVRFSLWQDTWRTLHKRQNSDYGSQGPDLRFDSHIEAITHKDAAVSSMIRTSFSSKDKYVLKLHMHQANCWISLTNLESTSQTSNRSNWNNDSQNQFQCRLAAHPYIERLKLLNLQTLEKCRILAI